MKNSISLDFNFFRRKIESTLLPISSTFLQGFEKKFSQRKFRIHFYIQVLSPFFLIRK
ncbi:hypothetical protein LEP1GSC036_0352 [Leptospira weilii str. 2006001853]|uniref:Uncharacterized protein n=3 Tax=Leptospira weilii TaxID=28184 RepID=A0A828Z5B2_9LEPT|nr:hypothetical protein LEP1GSC036_0352 [Leptospira weilii str. 2006001853]EMM73700.1 hypothetical protein LEP1GSC038_2671 [Leptospira weilii str. 2006001855]EMN44089.1 hypothetical protein LEP1GSC086_0800 [Leptospira weilii str. LNT 1234]EMY14509.1 hypothetical protein LEP1GSC043_4502 [Leptospira weilii str. Ecochallenge]